MKVYKISIFYILFVSHSFYVKKKFSGMLLITYNKLPLKTDDIYLITFFVELIDFGIIFLFGTNFFKSNVGNRSEIAVGISQSTLVYL